MVPQNHSPLLCLLYLDFKGQDSRGHWAHLLQMSSCRVSIHRHQKSIHWMFIIYSLILRCKSLDSFRIWKQCPQVWMVFPVITFHPSQTYRRLLVVGLFLSWTTRHLGPSSPIIPTTIESYPPLPEATHHFPWEQHMPTLHAYVPRVPISPELVDKRERRWNFEWVLPSSIRWDWPSEPNHLYLCRGALPSGSLPQFLMGGTQTGGSKFRWTGSLKHPSWNTLAALMASGLKSGGSFFHCHPFFALRFRGKIRGYLPDNLTIDSSWWLTESGTLNEFQSYASNDHGNQPRDVLEFLVPDSLLWESVQRAAIVCIFPFFGWQIALWQISRHFTLLAVMFQ